MTRSHFSQVEKFPGEGPLTVWEKDQAFQDYLRTKKAIAESMPSADVETVLQRTAETLLQGNASDRITEAQLEYCGRSSLANSVAVGYNMDRLPETATA